MTFPLPSSFSLFSRSRWQSREELCAFTQLLSPPCLAWPGLAWPPGLRHCRAPPPSPLDPARRRCEARQALQACRDSDSSRAYLRGLSWPGLLSARCLLPAPPSLESGSSRARREERSRRIRAKILLGPRVPFFRPKLAAALVWSPFRTRSFFFSFFSKV